MVLAREDDFVLHGLPMREPFPSGQSLLAPVVKEALLCLPSSGARSRFLFGVVGVEEVRPDGSGLFIRFLCVFFAKVFCTDFLE